MWRRHDNDRRHTKRRYSKVKITFKIEQIEAFISENFTLNGFEDLAKFKVPLDLNFIAPLKRRRLNRAGQCAFFLYEKFAFKMPPLLVFSSFVGEVNNCFSMLNECIKNEPLSPNAFSLSVLNATPALLAIHTQNHNEIAAISGEPALEYGIISAYTKLCEKRDKKAFVMSYFESFGDDPKFLMCALKMSLKKPNFCLEISPKTSEISIEKPVLSELKFLQNYDKNYEFDALNLHFKWSKI